MTAGGSLSFWISWRFSFQSIATSAVTVALRLALSRQRSHRVGNNLVGENGAGFLVVLDIGVARDSRRRGADRAQIAGSLRGSDWLAIRDSRPVAPDFGPVLSGRGRRVHHVRLRVPKSVFPALGLDAGSGIVDIVLASIIIFDLPGTSAWTMGLLSAINMILGGSALIAMGLHARTEIYGSNANPTAQR